jgi:transposase
MSKISSKGSVRDAELFAGIDVSAKTLAVAVQNHTGDGLRQREFANSESGHKQMIAWLLKGGAKVRVTMEATGTYSLDVALALDASAGITVAVLNPKTANRFAQTLCRSKTDKADAQALAEYSLRMPLVPWRRPGPKVLELRGIGRHIATLVQDHTRYSNRLHAAEASATTARCVRQDLKRSLAGLGKRILQLRRQALELVRQDAELARKFEQLIAIPGIAETSAVQLLSELAGLDRDMTVRQWVAHSGLDPMHRTSGSSVHRPSRISRHGNRHLRRALYMPALVGVRHDPYMKSFYNLLQARHKTKLQALMAVARKLLHAIFGIFKSNSTYDGKKLFPQLTPTC